ncbi:AfsR/SARP family transcriptional regulator [Sphaerimonospora sp. CA-214678]|uniref:AfsR/SARP family transcriptional regulator n=1 Tax=Sphaerimonospora sp. CA-214678 TaxID=3240029 RepID=UPI003D8E509E
MGLWFGVLGPLQVARDGQAVRLGTLKQRLLLTVLLLERNRTVSLDDLVGALWEDRPPKSAVFNVRTYVNQLRQALRDPREEKARESREEKARESREEKTRKGRARSPQLRIVGRRPGYSLVVDSGELDSVEFGRLLREGRAELARRAPRQALRRLSEALALWRGHPAEDVPRTLAVAGWLDSLEEQRCLALEAHAAARLTLGEHDTLITDLRDLLAVHPTRERLWGHLMLALYRSGDVAAALSAYTAARRSLTERLGVDPGADLVALHGRMLARDPVLDLGAPGAPAALGAPEAVGAAGPLAPGRGRPLHRGHRGHGADRDRHRGRREHGRH